MQELKANIQINGFTVVITEGVSLFFSASQENIARLMSLDDKNSVLNGMLERAERALKPIEARIQKSINENSFDKEAVNESIQTQAKFARELYDYIYGVGTFESLYSKIHDVSFWLENVEEIFRITLRGLEAEGKARKRRVLEAQKKYINKKNRRRKR